MDLITNSRLRCLKTCARQHYYRYEKCLRPDREGAPLRRGRAFHHGQELLGSGSALTDIGEAIRHDYSERPEWADENEWACECETVIRLLYAWQWRWEGDGIDVIETERIFRLPILNPETGAATPLFERAGKMDQVVRLADGRTALREFKTTTDDLAADSDYWSILRLDPQISNYFSADNRIETILYDVTRWPAIRPSQVPIRDELGLKIVLDANGERVKGKSGKWRETGDVEQGWKVQNRVETPQEFGERLTADIGERPDFYFARVEVARLSADVEEFKAELWQDQQLLRHRQKKGLWSKSPGRSTCDYCDYKSLCFNGSYPLDPSVIPQGYRRTENVHEELETSKLNGNDHITPQAQSAGAAECAVAH